MPSLQGLAWRNIGPAVAGGRTSGVAGTDADPMPLLLRWRRRRRLEDDQRRVDLAERMARRGGRRNRCDCNRSPPSATPFGSEPANRTCATISRTATAFGSPTTVARTGATSDCATRGRSRRSRSIPETRSASGWRPSAIPIATARREASTERPTAAELGGARSIWDLRAAPRTSQSTALIRMSFLPESGNSDACRGVFQAEVRSTASSSPWMAAFRGASCAETAYRAATWGGLAWPSRGSASTP